MKYLLITLYMFSLAAIAEGKTPSFPKAFQGTWDINFESCYQQHSEMRLVINSNFAEYWESQAELKKLIIEKDHLIRIELAMSGEGEQWISARIFKLTDSANKLVISDLQGIISTRERCL